MMMPANFTAVNSEVVYGGADLLSVLGATTAPVWNAANVKQFNTNVLTLISNSFSQMVINNTIGVMFSGNWGEDNKMFGDEGKLKLALYGDDSTDMNFGNKVMRTLGAAAFAYTLGTAPATIDFNDGVMGVTQTGTDGKSYIGIKSYAV